jgi:copper chaperone NosL
MTDRSRLRKVLTAAAIVGALALLVAGVIARLQRLPTEPVPIAWDREACAHCHMLIGNPAFAGQIQTTDGRVLDFDDPGCLMAYEVEQHPDEHAVWLHEVYGERWLPIGRVAFVPVPSSPMGYDLGAVEVGTPGAISLDEARARALGPRTPRLGGER